ncbi:MAG: hypothetical protein IJT74_02610 [Bacteroidales bacterium]|nr:hypothetical protein [Bacteroidales bacterium]
MTAKDLIEQLSRVAPDTEIVGGMWNGRTNTYTVLDELHVFGFDDIYNDFYGTPGAFDDKLLDIRSKDVVYLGSLFDSCNERVMEDRGTLWQMRKVLRQHRSREWKQERIYKLLTEFDEGDYTK